jgi:4-amino-4-deoxy-L-arabinose transferase-like glycosyltransferase
MHKLGAPLVVMLPQCTAPMSGCPVKPGTVGESAAASCPESDQNDNATRIDKDILQATAMESQKKRAVLMFTLFLVLALLTRFPFFFHDVINWDESTFILVGQSIVDGHLPYVTLYDLKPPILFAFFAAIIWVGGKSILAVRLAGMLCVWLVACFTYSIGRRIWSASVGTLGGILYVIASAVIAGGRGQATMSETVALVPLVASLVLLLRTPGSASSLFVAGILIAIAALVRSNLVFVAFAVGIWVLITHRQRPPLEIARNVLAYCVGGGLVLLLALLPYVLANEAKVFWDAVFVAPIIYSSSQLGPLSTITTQVTNALGIFPGHWFPNTENLLGLGIWATGIVGLLIAFKGWRRDINMVRHRQWLVMTYALAVGFSIVFGGAAYSHYLIQLLPFFCVYAALVYSRVADYPTRKRFSLPLAAIVSVLALLPVARQYSIIVYRIRSGVALAYGPSYDIAKILRPACLNGCSLYLLTDQLAYWFLNATPPTKVAVHPAMIVMESTIRAADGPTATPESEMRKILQTMPDYIVKPDVVWYLGDSSVRDILEAMIKSRYRILATTGDQTIYQRIEP